VGSSVTGLAVVGATIGEMDGMSVIVIGLCVGVSVTTGTGIAEDGVPELGASVVVAGAIVPSPAGVGCNVVPSSVPNNVGDVVGTLGT